MSYGDVFDDYFDKEQKAIEDARARFIESAPAKLAYCTRADNETLLDYFVAHTGPVSDVKLNFLRAEFANQLRNIILDRMTNGS